MARLVPVALLCWSLGWLSHEIRDTRGNKDCVRISSPGGAPVELAVALGKVSSVCSLFLCQPCPAHSRVVC
jgi:hypothetical protein